MERLLQLRDQPDVPPLLVDFINSVDPNNEDASVQEVRAILSAHLEHDTAIVKKAQDDFYKFLEKQEAVTPLIELGRSDQNEDIRIYSYYYLFHVLKQSWADYPEEEQDELAAVFLDDYKEEESLRVQKEMAQVINALGGIVIPAGRWDGLFEFVEQCLNSSSQNEQEQGMVLLSEAAWAFNEEVLDQHWPKFDARIEELAESGSPSLQKLCFSTVKVLGVMIEFPFFKKYPKWIPFVFDESAVSHPDLVAGVFNSLSQMPFEEVFEVFGEHLAMMTKAAVEIAEACHSTNIFKVRILRFLRMIVENKACAMYESHGIESINTLLHCCLSIMSEEDPAKKVEEDGPAKDAVSLLILLISKLPAEVVFPAYLKLVKEVSSGSDVDMKVAPLVTFSDVFLEDEVINSIADHLEPIVDFLLEKKEDSDPTVQYYATRSLTDLYIPFHEELRSKHADVVPSLLRHLHDLSSDLVEFALTNLHYLLQGLEPKTIYSYVEDGAIVERLRHVFASSEKSLYRTIGYYCLVEMLSNKSSPLLKDLILENSRATFKRARSDENAPELYMALKCVGDLISSLPQDQKPSAQEVQSASDFALEALFMERQYDQQRMKAILFIRQVMTIPKAKFPDQWLQIIVCELLQTCQKTPDDDDDDEEVEEVLNGVDALGLIFRHQYPIVADRLTEIVHILSQLEGSNVTKLKAVLSDSYLDIFSGFHHQNMNRDGIVEWVKAKPAATPLSKEAKEFADKTMTQFWFKCLEEETSLEVIHTTLSNIDTVIQMVGPDVFKDHLKEIIGLLLVIFEKRAKWQLFESEWEDVASTNTSGEDEAVEEIINNEAPAREENDDGSQGEEEDGNESDESDEEEYTKESCLGMAISVLQTFAQAFGSIMRPYIKQIEKSFEPFYEGAEGDGVLEEAAISMTVMMTSCESKADVSWKYIDLLVEHEVISNVPFLISVVMKNTKKLRKGRLQKALGLLTKLASMEEKADEGFFQDNVTAAYSSILDTHLLPLKARRKPTYYNAMINYIFSSAPFEHDFSENGTILRLALKLYSRDRPAFMKHKEAIDRLFTEFIFSERSIIDGMHFLMDVKPFLKTQAKKFAAPYLKEQVAKMSPSQKEEFAQIMA